MSQNILQYESKVWSTADLLIGAGIKQSDFPKNMMPYFALILLESRLLRHYNELLKDFDVEKAEDLENVNDFVEEFQDYNIGYNDIIVRQHKSLKDICKNDKTFDNDFEAYLKAFDVQTKELLGVDRANTEEKYLDISGISGQLKKKDILFDTVKKWSEIDLQKFNNSEITTLEEHIKRKWADISAETAGEQYTPDDIIALISEIILSKIDDNGEFLTIYDPTCGGGNLLFGVEDKIVEKYNRPTKTYGQDWSDSLYALAKIESRFRTDSEIIYGNTLTKIPFIEKRFDVIVANPPYGVDWKGYKKDIINDETERFHDLPSISDGQLLFTQHILYQLENEGLAVVVHNGSTLFSGDAGSGESNIRKYFFDNDWVEAIIQMPTDEFFNTGIYTYLWVFNKNKAEERKNKVILINGSDFYEPLKKSKGKKRKEMTFNKREIIIEALTNFRDSDYAKVFDKWHFYYNKQAIMLTNLDENGESYQQHLPWKTSRFEPYDEYQVKENKINLATVKQNDITITQTKITSSPDAKYPILKDYFTESLKPLIAQLDYKEEDLVVTTAGNIKYYFDKEKNTIIQEDKNGVTEMGCGKIVVKATYKKATKTQAEHIIITGALTADNEKDYEIIPYNPNPEENQQNIANFMAKYITKPFKYLDNTIGVELNFNKVFYKPEKLRSLVEITTDLQDLENELSNLEKELAI